MELIDDRRYLEPPKYSKDYVYRCDICNEEIFEGEECYEINSLIYCPECMETDFKVIAESIDIEGYLSDLK
ncbi:MAG: hypothetical protein IJC57_01665, partial [Clostridia bacterium]|nr:hypothetical protein [Clostridia bacterium]